MKKVVLSLLLLCGMQAVMAQSKLGLKLSPTLSLTRTDYSGNEFDVDADGSGGRFVFGLIYDHMLTENYYFSTGLLYAPKRAGFSVRETGTTAVIEEAYNLQYLQVPLTLKLFTNELALDTRVYFQLGGLAEIKVAEKPQNEDFSVVDDFKFFDTSLYIGSGIERRLGYNTIIFGGIFYNRGLVNVASDIQYDFDIHNDLIGLDLGVKF